jgi:pimeloyl-ACP methyl ester carboxylesterase
MPFATINGVRIFSEQHGESGPPLVLVHGSWGDHHNWDAVAPMLARTFRVFTYDRRGHSQSERLSAQGSIEEDVADLSAFITANDLSPAHVAGNSFGAAIALKLAAAQPDLFASLIVHEPPLIAMLGDHPALPVVRRRIGVVLDKLRSGNMALGAEQFVETVALGPGMWAKLPPEMQQTFVFNAPTWLDEMTEPEQVMAVDVARLASFPHPVLITKGDQSPPFFGVILDIISRALPDAQHYTFHGAGHVPHLTHPDEYVKVATEFGQRGTAGAAAPR